MVFEIDLVLSHMRIKTSIGSLVAEFGPIGLKALTFSESEEGVELAVEENGSKEAKLLKQEMESYFNETLRKFSVTLDPEGTSFQKSIWRLLQEIPCGQTISYQELANTYGEPKAIRAIAAANGANPIPILIPCHRVIGADGKHTGYSGGLWRKEFLLDLESGVKRLF
jgi:O-6-methylguanine DNA methyltransferase